MSDTHAQSSLNEQSTSDHDVSLDATAPAFTTTSSTTFPKLLKEWDLDSLSPRSQAIKLLIADEMADGHNLSMLASELGLSSSSASSLLAELRSELELQTGPVPPLTPDEFQALKDSIEQDGVRVPVIVGEHTLIDGRHRWRASRELGLKEIPAIFLPGLTAEQERDACIAVNAVRRQLSREQRNALVRAELARDGRRSSRQIAALCGVHHSTVESIRTKIREEAQVVPSDSDVDAVREFVEQRVQPETRVDTLGRVQPVPERQELPAERPLAYVNCSRCGQRHVLVKDGSAYRLETI